MSFAFGCPRLVPRPTILLPVAPIAHRFFTAFIAVQHPATSNLFTLNKISVMRKIFFLSLLFIFVLYASSFAQSKTDKPAFNIRQYWFVMLTAGTNRAQDSLTAAKIQEGHMANISKAV